MVFSDVDILCLVNMIYLFLFFVVLYLYYGWLFVDVFFFFNVSFFFFFFFFFQAEDGIRDLTVTGVQTCALPISDREMYLPINLDIDQLPFIRPAGQPITVLNHPPFIRMEGRSIPPLGSRDAKFRVPGNLMTAPGTYRLAVRMRSRAAPTYFMTFIGATTAMNRAMTEWMVDLHPYSVEFTIR